MPLLIKKTVVQRSKKVKNFLCRRAVSVEVLSTCSPKIQQLEMGRDQLLGIVDMSTTTFTHPALELELNDK